MNALQSLHGCSSSLELMPTTSVDCTTIEIVLISTWYTTEIGKRPPALITKHGNLPSEPYAAAARVLGALYEHDARISREVYKQVEIDA